MLCRKWLFPAAMLAATTLPLSAAELPPELLAVKQQVVEITSNNTTRIDNVPEVRAQLEPLIAQLEAWFNANRPANEVALTQVPWKNLWYDDPDISFDFQFGPLQLLQPRDRIFQVIEDGFYYNVSEFQLVVFEQRLVLSNYLKGAYTIARPAGPGNVGEPRLNTVDLEFVGNSVFPGTIPARLRLSPLVRGVDRGLIPTIPVPGPLGVTGELWNRYVDEDLRIAAGFDDSEPQTIDLYILRRVARAE
jgi:hypothetical protein